MLLFVAREEACLSEKLPLRLQKSGHAAKRLGVPFLVKAEKYPYHLIWIMPA